MSGDALTPVDEDWEHALAVVAHPDDLEFGAAAAVARWTDAGKRVTYCMVTSGEAGIDGLPPAESAVVREAEQIESARIVGVDTVEFLRLTDGVLEYGAALRAMIAHVVRRLQPEIVITNNFRETWGGEILNQADHIAVGRATVTPATAGCSPTSSPTVSSRGATSGRSGPAAPRTRATASTPRPPSSAAWSP